VSIPIVHFKMDVRQEIRGRGVMPDNKVSQDWEDIITGKNSKLEFCIKINREDHPVKPKLKL
jgi:hypothetical protein